MTNSLRIENLNKKFNQNFAVNNVSFKTSPGEIIAILGPNGAGKSTLMNMISGFLSPSSGKIFVFEEDIAKNPIEGKEKIGFLPEGAPLYPDLSVANFLKYMAELRGFKGKDKKTRLELKMC